MTSKTTRVNNCRKALLRLFSEYAFHVQEWEVEAEGDYDDLEEGVNKILEGFVDAEGN